MNNSTTVAGVPWNGLRFARDWSDAAIESWKTGDRRGMQRLAQALMPMGQAHAALSQPDLKAQAEVIGKVLSGDATVSLDNVLNFNKLFPTVKITSGS